MALTTCSSCESFVPVLAACCPGCGAPRSALPRVAARVAVAAGFVTTLMACYGGPPPHAVAPTVSDDTSGDTAQPPAAQGDGTAPHTTS